jgi:ABC-2 type transport system ATP-binding protein
LGRALSLLKVKKISKHFGSFQVLDSVSFEMNKGDIVGLLGKNGAGKTTLMRILTSFITPSSGTVNIDGEDIFKHSISIRQKIGYLPEKPPLYGDMTVQYYLNFAAEIKGVPKNKRLFQLAKVLEECDLEQVKQKTIATLSKGYKQRVGIAQAIIHEPKLLILDEPTSGLDPMQIQQVLALIKNQRDQRTVLLSTHTLTEIEQVAQRVLMIKSGRIVLDDSLEALLKDEGSTQSQPLTLEQIFINHHQPQTSESTTQTPEKKELQEVSHE